MNTAYRDKPQRNYVATANMASYFSYRPFSMFDTRLRFVGEDDASKLLDIMRFPGHCTFVMLPFLKIVFTSRCSLSKQ